MNSCDLFGRSLNFTDAGFNAFRTLREAGSNIISSIAAYHSRATYEEVAP